MNFPDRLRPLVDRVGGPAVAATICGVTRQTVNMWLRGGGNPNAATQAGAILLLKTKGRGEVSTGPKGVLHRGEKKAAL